MSDQITSLLKQLKERRAVTFQDRIKSLDIRDEIWRKYIELNKGSGFDAIAAQRTGLCQDMCCERERLTREYQRSYKLYELEPDTRTLNHSLMVTEYSRASADQAMPTPYDLRSGQALLNTMNYLITNIMDKFDQDREQGDWYNFLWDRLRAIRKELTQQHMRDEISIEILEQCARFHIFCSAFLSEHSRDLFDPNLNDKMLIDCLNQLHDCYLTHKKQNNAHALKNMAEFSSYMLLINLKEDNETLLRIRHLIQDITEAPEIDISIDISRSLLISNTTRFFSLIENKATLLQSCLLHRYFNIIRLKRLNSFVSSARANDELRLSDLTEALGMDNDDDTKEFLEQLGHSVSNATPSCLIIQSTDCQVQQQSINRLSQKLIKSKFKDNLKDIISGYSDSPIIVADTLVEDSFDLQGCFVGKLPVDLDKLPTTTTTQKALIESTAQESSVLPKRLSESAFRSMAATGITENVFSSGSRIGRPTNVFSMPTTTTSSSFRIGVFDSSRIQPQTTTAPSAFRPPLVTRPFAPQIQPLFGQRPTLQVSNPQSSLLQAPPVPVVITQPFVREQTPSPQTPEPIIQPPAPLPPRPRRLSTNSMDTFINEIYDQLISSIIKETGQNLFDEFISQRNKLASQTVRIFNEWIHDEIVSLVDEYYSEVAFNQKLLNDTLIEYYERQRKKYLRKKYFSIWLEQTIQANEDRLILSSIQEQYHFSNNEQILEFLTGVQLIADYDLTLDQTSEILRYRRYLKRNHSKKVEFLSHLYFEEFLQEELRSIVTESNKELQLRKSLLEKALERQTMQKREHYLQLKYFSLWILKFRQRQKLFKQQLLLNNNKRTNQCFHMRSNKKLKENSHQYQTIKRSLDQLSTDLNQMQFLIDKLNS